MVARAEARVLGVDARYGKLPNIHRAAKALAYLTRAEANRGIQLGVNEAPVTHKTSVLDREHLPIDRGSTIETAYMRQQLGFLAAATMVKKGIEMLDQVLERGRSVLLYDTTKAFGEREVPEYGDWGSHRFRFWTIDGTPTRESSLRIGWFLRDIINNIPEYSDAAIFPTVDAEVSALMGTRRVKLAPRTAIEYLGSHPEARAMELALRSGRRINRFGYTNFHWAIKHDGLGVERQERPSWDLPGIELALFHDQLSFPQTNYDDAYLVRDMGFSTVCPSATGLVQSGDSYNAYYPAEQIAYVKVTTADDPEILET